MIEVAYKFYICVTGEFPAFSAMVELLFRAAYAKITAGMASALKKAVLCRIPATFTQRYFAHHSFSILIFSNPAHAPIPPDQFFRCLPVMLHSDFIRTALSAMKAASR